MHLKKGPQKYGTGGGLRPLAGVCDGAARLSLQSAPKRPKHKKRPESQELPRYPRNLGPPFSTKQLGWALGGAQRRRLILLQQALLVLSRGYWAVCQQLAWRVVLCLAQGQAGAAQGHAESHWGRQRKHWGRILAWYPRREAGPQAARMAVGRRRGRVQHRARSSQRGSLRRRLGTRGRPLG